MVTTKTLLSHVGIFTMTTILGLVACIELTADTTHLKSCFNSLTYMEKNRLKIAKEVIT